MTCGGPQGESGVRRNKCSPSPCSDCACSQHTLFPWGSFLFPRPAAWQPRGHRQFLACPPFPREPEHWPFCWVRVACRFIQGASQGGRGLSTDTALSSAGLAVPWKQRLRCSSQKDRGGGGRPGIPDF